MTDLRPLLQHVKGFYSMLVSTKKPTDDLLFLPPWPLPTWLDFGLWQKNIRKKIPKKFSRI